MTTNISTPQESPKSRRWTELRDRITSFFNKMNEKEDTTKPKANGGPAEPNAGEVLTRPSEHEGLNEPRPRTTNEPSSDEPEAPDPTTEIKAALQRIEEALTALPRIEEALLNLPTPASAATPDSPATPTPTPTEEHHVGAILLTYVAEKKRWTGLWAHKLLEEPEGKAEQHLPGAILLARTVVQHGQKVKGEPAKTLQKWAQREEAEPPVQSAETSSSG